RVQNLGRVTDSMMLDWTFDFQRVGDTVIKTLRPQHPLAAQRSPIEFSLQGNFDESDPKLREAFRRSFGFGSSDRVDIPGESLTSFSVRGPEFLAGMKRPTRFILERMSTTPGVG